MDTSGSAMQAERMRAEVVAANMANTETTHTAAGGPYRRQHVVFGANAGDPGFLDSLATVSASGSSSGKLPGMQPMSMLGAPPTVVPGVRILGVVEDPSPPLIRFDPGHPDAGPDGFVAYPDINPISEMVDLMGATRAYGLNGSAVQAEKSMINSALEIAKS
jgi:flagellar basal-body rod protein FlgC